MSYFSLCHVAFSTPKNLRGGPCFSWEWYSPLLKLLVYWYVASFKYLNMINVNFCLKICASSKHIRYGSNCVSDGKTSPGHMLLCMTYIWDYYREFSLRFLKRNKRFDTDLHGGILQPLKFMWVSVFPYRYFWKKILTPWFNRNRSRSCRKGCRSVSFNYGEHLLNV